MQTQPSPMVPVQNGPPSQVMEHAHRTGSVSSLTKPDVLSTTYPPCPKGQTVATVYAGADYVFDPLFEQRFNHARKIMDAALGSLLNLHPPTLRVAATLLGQLKLIELGEYHDFYKSGAVVTTMAVSSTKLLFHPDLILYYANVLNPATDEKEITRRRKRLTTMIVHEAMHYVQGDTQAADPYRISLADQPDKVNLIMSVSNLIYDAIHDESMANTVQNSRGSSTGDADLEQYLDEQMIRDHAGDMREGLEQVLTDMEADPSEIADLLKMLKTLGMDKQTALGKCVTVMAGSGGWNKKPPPPIGGTPGPCPPQPNDGGGDEDEDSGEDSDSGKEQDSGGGASGTDPEPGDPGQTPKRGGGLSQQSEDLLNQNNHVVADPVKDEPEVDENGNIKPDTRTPQDKAREQIENEQAEAESNRHKAKSMAGDETGLFNITTKIEPTKKELDWRKLLAGAIRSATRRGQKPSFRKYRQEEAMRGIYLPIKEDRQAHAAALMDVSGSVLWAGPEMLGQFVYSMTSAITQAGLNELTILPFDGGAHEPVVIDRSNMHRIRRDGLDTGGGGGTTLDPTLADALVFQSKGQFPKLNQHSCLMVATDAELEAPDPALYRRFGMGSIIYLVPDDDNGRNLNHYARMFCDEVISPKYVRRTGATARVIFVK